MPALRSQQIKNDLISTVCIKCGKEIPFVDSMRSKYEVGLPTPLLWL